MKDSLEFLLVIGLMGLLFLLRLDAQRFGVAEYDDSDQGHGWRGWARRIGWFGLGLALLLLVYWLYPHPITVLHLDMASDREQAVIYGLVAGIGGIVLAFLFAWFRYGGFRLPAPGAYPGALLNSVGTAVIDEALFRGILLGVLLIQGFSPTVAIVIQAVVYGVATRLWVGGRSKGMLFIDLAIALVGGWLVVETGGIGAAIIAHAITRFGVFLATGHSGQARPVGWEPEEVAGRALPPAGWDLAAEGTGSQAWMAPPSGPPGLGPAYAGQSPFAPPGYGGGPGYGGQPGWAPPPGLSSVPMSGPAYPDSQFAPPPGWDPSASSTGGPEPSAGPWVADPVTGEWSPVQLRGEWHGQSPPGDWAGQPPPSDWGTLPGSAGQPALPGPPSADDAGQPHG